MRKRFSSNEAVQRELSYDRQSCGDEDDNHTAEGFGHQYEVNIRTHSSLWITDI